MTIRELITNLRELITNSGIYFEEGLDKALDGNFLDLEILQLFLVVGGLVIMPFLIIGWFWLVVEMFSNTYRGLRFLFRKTYIGLRFLLRKIYAFFHRDKDGDTTSGELSPD